MYTYKCTVTKIIDGDTIDVDIHLGFDVVLTKQRIRLMGIDTPESRTRNLEEKAKREYRNVRNLDHYGRPRI